MKSPHLTDEETEIQREAMSHLWSASTSGRAGQPPMSLHLPPQSASSSFLGEGGLREESLSFVPIGGLLYLPFTWIGGCSDLSFTGIGGRLSGLCLDWSAFCDFSD